MITARSAFTWQDQQSSVVQLDGPVQIRTDDADLSADSAVIWLTTVDGAILDQFEAEIALIGNARAKVGDVEREGGDLLIRTRVRGTIRITANERVARNLDQTDLFRQAADLRAGRVQLPPVDERDPDFPDRQPPRDELQPQPDEGTAPEAVVPPRVETRREPPAEPSTAPATLLPGEPVNFRAGSAQTVQSPDDRVALILSGNVVVFQRRTNGDFIELQSERAVLYTKLRSLRDLENSSEFKSVEDSIDSGYLEGDVRITYTSGVGRPEQRLRAQRIFYEFATDRAILTDAVFHTIEPVRQIPVIMRANTLRQLAIGEYNAEGVELSTSSFQTPSYAVAAQKAYVRSVDTGNPRFGNRTTFSARNMRLNAFGVPVFYLPYAAGSMTDRGGPLRDIQFENNDRFGFGVVTEWGLYETFGRLPPENFDATYRLDYFSDRGFATGINAAYTGGHITETTRQPWNFGGEVKSYFVFDHGDDTFGGNRFDVDPKEDVRGRILWTHQHFFPDDWQVQLRGGWVSDPNFLEQWFRRTWTQNEPHDVSAYFKRQRDSEALSLLLNFQPNNFVTTSDLIQEQFEVERLPEIGYRRIGQSLAEDQFTLFSDNTATMIRFNPSDATLEEQGYTTGVITPGIPSVGQTGVNDDWAYRADFRQQIDYPVQAGQFKFVPYILGRYTPYSDSPDGDALHRIFIGAGMRVTTAIWGVDNTFQSRWFDINRIRHVIEPELHLFTSAVNEDRNDVFIYEEPVDGIHDISAVQLLLRQRWQTKRGGPGRWRSVDFFTLNVGANFFANQPKDDELPPDNFRGLFFSSMPEASIPRNSINADATWRVADTTAILSDIQYNLDKEQVATASLGVVVQRDINLSYYLGQRYIEELNSNITTAAVVFRISPKYSVTASQSYDFGDNENVGTSATVVRRFDRFYFSVTGYYDNASDVGGFNVSIQPQGLTRGLDVATVRTFFPATPQ